MATKQEIFDYVMNTPQNTNAAVLSSLLDNLESGINLDYTVEFTLNDQEEITSAKYYHNDEELTFLEFLKNYDEDGLIRVKFGEAEPFGLYVEGDPDEKWIIINLPMFRRGGMFIYLEEETYISDFSNNFSIQTEEDEVTLTPNYSFDQFNRMRSWASMRIKFDGIDIGTGIIEYSSDIEGHEVIEIFANPNLVQERIGYFYWLDDGNLSYKDLDLTVPE